MLRILLGNYSDLQKNRKFNYNFNINDIHENTR